MAVDESGRHEFTARVDGPVDGPVEVTAYVDESIALEDDGPAGNEFVALTVVPDDPATLNKSSHLSTSLGIADAA
jgi:hypothetical protein